MKKIICHDTTVVITPLLTLDSENESRKRHLRERATVHAILNELGLPEKVDHLPDGSPFLPGYDGYISISHSQESVAIALNTSRRIGIDTETWRPQLERVKHKFLSVREQEIYHGNPGLLLAWCMKEAAYKAAGVRGLDFAESIQLPETLDGDILHIPSIGLILKAIKIELTERSATVLCIPS